MRASVEQLRVLAGEILHRATEEHPGLDRTRLLAVLSEFESPAIAEGDEAAEPMLFALP
jgi:hypothetical protein